MGVPAFFRWLVRRYKKVLVRAEEAPESPSPLVVEQMNPNGVEWDNLYLDMNGIIHPCAHPEDEAAPPTETAMFEKVFAYIDRIVAIVRPRKLLYMAIDGVAPRAKTNQQRARRFKTAQEAAEEHARLAELMGGEHGAPAKAWDSNVITPGTPFMARLSLALRYYIAVRMNTAPGWKGVVVMLSDSNVPGEGEHKIMEYIRSQRMVAGYEPNLNHCLYGTDADLIMLALATHEPHFFILREHLPERSRSSACFVCGKPGHIASRCPYDGDPVALETAKAEAAAAAAAAPKVPKPYDIVDVAILREYLLAELTVPTPFEWSDENVLDDFVFLCFFVGNDFLPHLPSLRIREGALDKLLRIYKAELPRMGGFLTDSGDLVLDRVQVLIDVIGRMEDDVFKERKRNSDRISARNANRRAKIDVAELAAAGVDVVPLGVAAMDVAGVSTDAEPGDADAGADADSPVPMDEVETAAAAAAAQAEEEAAAAAAAAATAAEEAAAEDEVRLWEEGWKKRHYKSKFGVDLERDVLFRRDLARAYVQGLVWVFRYYYQGCASWRWYYPYHYAPFASDLTAIIEFEADLDFDLGTPFPPLTQLMAVLPPASKDALPAPYQTLMTDAHSPLIEFYPETFELDLNGHTATWMAVVLLPFIDEARLLAALEDVDDQLTPAERARNTPRHEVLFAHSANVAVAPFLAAAASTAEWVPVDMLTAGIAGSAGPPSHPLAALGAALLAPPHFPAWPGLDFNWVVAADFAFPTPDDPDFVHEPDVLPGAVFPPPVLSPIDRHEAASGSTGRGNRRGPQRNSNGHAYSNNNDFGGRFEDPHARARRQTLAARHPHHGHVAQSGFGPVRGPVGANRFHPY